MAGKRAGSGEMVPQGDVGEVVPLSGRIMKESFAVVDTLKAQGGFTVYRIRFKVRLGGVLDNERWWKL